MRQHVRNSLHSRLPEMRPPQQQQRFAPSRASLPIRRKIFVLTSVSDGSLNAARSLGKLPISGERTPSRPFRTSPYGTTPRLSPATLTAIARAFFYIDNSPYFADGAYYRYVPNYGYEEIAVPTDVVVYDFVPWGPRPIYQPDTVLRGRRNGSSLLTMVV